MEKKTFGKFLSALRRANGMTQIELADKLFVSDKSVSRWERDESNPDITLLPVIADIFNVTVDELLRGERIPAPAKTEFSDGEKLIAARKEQEQKREEKRIYKLLDKRYKKFFCLSILLIFLAVIITAIGLLFTEYIRPSHMKPSVFGSIIGSCGLLLCFITQVFITIFHLLPEKEESFSSVSVSFNRKILVFSKNSLLVMFSLLGFIVPVFFKEGRYFVELESYVYVFSAFAAIILCPCIFTFFYELIFKLLFARKKILPNCNWGHIYRSIVTIIFSIICVSVLSVNAFHSLERIDMYSAKYRSASNKVSTKEALIIVLQNDADPNDIPMTKYNPNTVYHVPDVYNQPVYGKKGAWNELDGDVFFWSNRDIISYEKKLSNGTTYYEIRHKYYVGAHKVKDEICNFSDYIIPLLVIFYGTYFFLLPVPTIVQLIWKKKN